MNRLTIAVTRVSPAAVLPAYHSDGAAGLDLSAAITAPHIMRPGEVLQVPCGFALAIPDGYEGQVRPRSGLAARHGITVLNAPGTIDADYRGEVCALLINLGCDAFTIEPGMRIAQLVVAPVMRITWAEGSELPATHRGSGGFGHTGA
jgi:dUTP pyrophosphatase